MSTDKEEDKVALVLILGQSNIANHGAYFEPFEYIPKSPIYYYNGDNIDIFTSPIGTKRHFASGNASSLFPYLGDMMVERLDYDKIIFVNAAIGGTTVFQWTPNAGSYERNIVGDDFIYSNGLFDRVREAKDISNKLDIPYTHILWHQGEDDNVQETSKADYKKYFMEIKDGIRKLNIEAPIYMARASFTSARSIPEPRFDKNIIAAQNELIKENSDILEGPNTDIIGVEDRYDGSHFNKEGLIKHANLWIESLTK
jgi:hypothetical protein